MTRARVGTAILAIAVAGAFAGFALAQESGPSPSGTAASDGFTVDRVDCGDVDAAGSDNCFRVVGFDSERDSYVQAQKDICAELSADGADAPPPGCDQATFDAIAQAHGEASADRP